MTRFATLALTPALVLTAASASAAPVALTAGDINGLDTNTPSFTDGNLTLTPLLGGVADSFNADAVLLGNDVTGSINVNAFNDPDTVSNGNDEELQFDFASGYGLSSITYRWTRADVTISGFSADPGATSSGGQTITYAAGTISYAQAWTGGNDVTLTFSNLAASDAQTLLLSPTDADLAGGQLSIVGITYDAVPEPGSLALLGLGGLLIARRRRS